MTATMTAAPARKPRPSKAAVPVLSLRIGGMAYALARVDPGEGGIIAWRLSKAGEDAPYDVRLAADGSASCTCADFVWRHDGNGSACKHILGVVAVGLMAGPSPVVESAAAVEVPATLTSNEGPVEVPPVEVAPAADPMPADAWGWARWVTRRWDAASAAQRVAAVTVLDGQQSMWSRFPAPADGEIVASPLPAREPTVAVTATVAEEGVGITPTTSAPLDSIEPCCPVGEPVPCAACADAAPAASYFGVGIVEAPELVEPIDFADEIVAAIATFGQVEPADPTDVDGPLPLILAIRRDAAAHRARGSSLALLYAEALDRLADLASAVEASRAEDVYDRADALDALRWNEALGRQYDLGRRAALAGG